MALDLRDLSDAELDAKTPKSLHALWRNNNVKYSQLKGHPASATPGTAEYEELQRATAAIGIIQTQAAKTGITLKDPKEFSTTPPPARSGGNENKWDSITTARGAKGAIKVKEKELASQEISLSNATKKLDMLTALDGIQDDLDNSAKNTALLKSITSRQGVIGWFKRFNTDVKKEHEENLQKAKDYGLGEITDKKQTNKLIKAEKDTTADLTKNKKNAVKRLKAVGLLGPFDTKTQIEAERALGQKHVDTEKAHVNSLKNDIKGLEKRQEELKGPGFIKGLVSPIVKPLVLAAATAATFFGASALNDSTAMTPAGGSNQASVFSLDAITDAASKALKSFTGGKGVTTAAAAATGAMTADQIAQAEKESLEDRLDLAEPDAQVATTQVDVTDTVEGLAQPVTTSGGAYVATNSYDDGVVKISQPQSLEAPIFANNPDLAAQGATNSSTTTAQAPTGESPQEAAEALAADTAANVTTAEAATDAANRTLDAVRDHRNDVFDNLNQTILDLRQLPRDEAVTKLEELSDEKLNQFRDASISTSQALEDFKSLPDDASDVERIIAYNKYQIANTNSNGAQIFSNIVHEEIERYEQVATAELAADTKAALADAPKVAAAAPTHVLADVLKSAEESSADQPVPVVTSIDTNEQPVAQEDIFDPSALVNGDGSDDFDKLRNMFQHAEDANLDESYLDQMGEPLVKDYDNFTNKENVAFINSKDAVDLTSTYCESVKGHMADGTYTFGEQKSDLTALMSGVAKAGLTEDIPGQKDDTAYSQAAMDKVQKCLSDVFDTKSSGKIPVTGKTAPTHAPFSSATPPVRGMS